MAISNMMFGCLFAAAVVGCLTVLTIVWLRRPKENR